MKTRSLIPGLPVVFAVSLLPCAPLDALTLVEWDIPGGTSTTALASSTAIGVNASPITLSGLNVSSASTLWRTRGYNDTTTRSITFSISAAPGNTVTLQELIFTANAQAGSGAAWTDPTLELEYSQSADFALPTSAGTLGLGGNLASGTGPQFTSTATTFFPADLVINSGETYYFRLVGLGANSGTQNQISYLSSADMQLNGTVLSSAADLVWAGTDGSNWNTTEPNFTKNGSPSNFTTNDNVTIGTAGGIQIHAGGINAGLVTHSAAADTTTLQGGNLTVAALVKSGMGTMAVNGPVTLATGAGTTTLSGGTLQVLDGATLNTNALLLSGGGTLRVEAGGVFSSSGPNTLDSGGGTLDFDGPVTMANIANPIVNNPLVKDGTGTLTVSGIGTQNTGPVALDILDGVVSASGPLGSPRQINIGGTHTFDGDLILNGPVLMLHGSTISGTGSIGINGTTSSITSRLNFGQVNVNVPVLLGTSLNLESPNGNNQLRLNAPISGDNNLVKKGNGVVVLAADNSYAGTTTVEAGTLRIGAGGAVGTLGAGDVSLTATGATLLFDRGDTVEVANVISGSGNIAVASGASAIVALTALNFHTGVTTITSGTLAAPHLADGYEDSSIGASAPEAERLVLNGGTLAHTGPAASTDRGFTLGINGGTITADGTGPLQFTSDADVLLTEPTPVTVGGLTTGFSYRIVDPGDTDFTLIGAPDNLPDTRFEATGPGAGTGTVVFANTRLMRLGGSAPGVSTFALALADAANAPTSLVKNGTNTWSITAANSHTGNTNVNGGILRIDGDSSGATGTIQVAAGAAVGGNGTAGGAVALAAGGGLAAKIHDWTGAPGSGYDDLTVASVAAGAGALTVVVDTAGLINFSEGDRSFTILNTTGGITGFNPALTSVSAPGFAGSGYWSLVQVGNSLVLKYSLTAPDPYLAWIGPFGVSDPAKSADPDNDGVSNLLEFVLNGNPAQSDPTILPGVETTATQLVLAFERRIDSLGVEQWVQYGTTLSGWNDLVIPTAAGTHVVGVATIDVTRDSETGLDQVTVSIPRSGPQLFARLVAREVAP